MQEIPECLSRRYKALDELVRELGTSESRPNADCSTGDPSIRLLCNFWNILKEDPDVNLSQAVQQRMCANPERCTLFGTHNISCYMAGCCKRNDDKKQDNINKSKSTRSKPSKECSEKNICCETQSTALSNGVEELPLNKVLCDLKQAASFEKKCQNKVNDLLETQARLQEQIQVLEQREKDGIQLLKQADCMWSCMEETYKKKIGESLERQKDLLKQLKEVEASNMKWRKNKKDLEFEIDHVNKCQQEIKEKINQKTNDIKCIDMEIVDFKKRIENNKKDLDVANNSFGSKKQASSARTTNIKAEVTRLEKVLKEEQKHKKAKEEEAEKYVKEARQDLQKLCKVLLQKKLESEDMRAEKEALLLEIDLLRENSDQCKDRCKNKQESINEEIKAIDKEIAEFKVKCIRCHECTDTLDIRRFCTDCPRCVNERDCLYVGDHCCPDNTMDCVCTTVKHKLLDNVFDNMYTVLERQVKSGPGKAVGDVVLNCLRKSRNGKLNAETRKILQDFILTTIKKNLNLTIVGGAVKTRCEMDRDTYKQLMLCLKQVKATKPAKVDRGTESKKDPCRRWGGVSECNCPKGPKDCICTKNAPPPPNEPAACPPTTEDKEDAGQAVLCPYKESAACGPDCAMHELPDAVGSEVASWRPNPCQGPTCQFRNMRAAQCVLGQESLSTFSSPKILRDEDPSKSGHSSTDPHVSKDTKQLKAVKDKINDKDSGKMVVESVGKSKLLKTMPNDKNALTDNNPIVLKSFSGDLLKIALHKTMIEEINKKLLEGTNIFVTLKTEFGQPVFSLQSDATIANDENIFLPKKSPSGNITLEAYKPIRKRSFDNVYIKESLNKLHEEIRNNGIDKITKDDSSYPNKSSLKKNNIDNIKEHKEEYNSSGTKINEIHEVKFKGVNNCKDKETIFAIKETSSDNFKIVLDKEFEIYHKQAIKEYEGDSSVQFAEFLKTNSGHFIINFKENSDDDKNKALLIKTESGNIKVLVDNSKTDHLLHKKESMSNFIMTANDIDKLLNKSQSISKKCSSQHSKITKLPVMIKSFSDSKLYKKDKLDIPDQNKQISQKGVSGSKNLECKANATSCGGQCQDNLCDKSKCVCKNICYKAKQWRWENSDHKNINKQYGNSVVKVKENSSISLKSSKLLGKRSDLSDAKMKFLKTPPEVPNNIRNNEQPGTESCGCSFTLEKMTKENYNNAIDGTCSYTRNKSSSNEYLDTDNNNKEQSSINTKACYKSKEQEIKKICHDTKHSWDTIEYLPPQLPPFLRDFSFP